MQFKNERLQKINEEIELDMLKLEELKAHAKNAAEDERLRLEEDIKTLQGHIDATRAMIEEYMEANADTWDHLKDSIEHAWAKARHAIHEAHAKIAG